MVGIFPHRNSKTLSGNLCFSGLQNATKILLKFPLRSGLLLISNNIHVRFEKTTIFLKFQMLQMTNFKSTNKKQPNKNFLASNFILQKNLRFFCTTRVFLKLNLYL
jgi:hypothetical protein